MIDMKKRDYLGNAMALFLIVIMFTGVFVSALGENPGTDNAQGDDVPGSQGGNETIPNDEGTGNETAPDGEQNTNGSLVQNETSTQNQTAGEGGNGTQNQDQSGEGSDGGSSNQNKNQTGGDGEGDGDGDGGDGNKNQSQNKWGEEDVKENPWRHQHREKIQSAVENGTVIMENTFSKKNGEVVENKFQYQNGTKMELKEAKGNALKIKVSAEFQEGKVVVLNVEDDVLQFKHEQKVKVMFDGKEVQHAAPEEVLEADGDEALYSSELGEDGSQFLVYIPHFSEHTIDIESVEEEETQRNNAVIIAVAIVIILIVIIIIIVMALKSKNES